MNHTMVSRRDLLSGAACSVCLSFVNSPVHADASIAAIVSHHKRPIKTAGALAGKRVCGGRRGEREFAIHVRRIGATFARVPAAEMFTAFERGVCQAMLFAGDNEKQLLKNLDTLLGRRDRYFVFFIRS